MTRDFEATPQQLYRAHTDKDLFARWMGPDGLDMQITAWDARTGGSWAYTAGRGEDSNGFHGCFHEVRDDRIVQTFTWDGEPDGVALETLRVRGSRRRSHAPARALAVRQLRGARRVVAHLQLGHPAVAAVGLGTGRKLCAVLLGVEADRRGLDAQREVLRDQGDVMALVGEVLGNCEDPGVVVAEPEAGGQRLGIGVVQLDPNRAACLTDGDRLIEPPVPHAQLVEAAERGAREEAQLGVVPLALQLCDHDHRQHDLVLVEPPHRTGVGEQHAGVEHVGPHRRRGLVLARLALAPVRGPARCPARSGGRCGRRRGGHGLARHGHTPHDRHAHSTAGPQLVQSDRDLSSRCRARKPECRPPSHDDAHVRAHVLSRHVMQS